MCLNGNATPDKVSRPDSMGSYADASGEKVRIEIVQQNSAYAYSKLITLTDKSISIKILNGIKQANSKTLWRRSLRSIALKGLFSVLDSCRLDTMRRVYDDPGIMDGMVIAFKICYQGKTTQIQLMNRWIGPLYRIASYINELLPANNRIDLHIPLRNRGQ
jgi:hypothetical protein